MIKHPTSKVKVAIVGKYLDIGDFSLTDSYVSIYQALVHAGAQLGVGIDISWINAQLFENQPQNLADIASFDGVIIPEDLATQVLKAKLQPLGMSGSCYSVFRTVLWHAIGSGGICTQ